MKKHFFSSLVKKISIPSFKKKGNTFSFIKRDLIYIINFQKSKFDIEEETFTINIGIYSGYVHELIWGNNIDYYPKEEDCILRTRIGEFTNGKDDWFALKNEDDVDIILKIINSTIEESVVPFLFQIHNNSDLYKKIENRKYNNQDYLYMMQLSCLAKIAGQLSESKILLNKVINSNSAWTHRALNVFQQLYS